jgi:hypothetical protein
MEGAMSTFNARLHLPGRAKLPLGVEIDIQHERMTLTSGDQTVAVIPVANLDLVSKSDGFHFTVDGEEVVLIVTESIRFAKEMGIVEQVRSPAIGATRRVARPVNGTSNGPTKVNGRVIATSQTRFVPTDDQHDDLQRRIGEIDEALNSESVTPAVAFSSWLALLNELNRRHARGTMATAVFCRLNSRLLDLIPVVPVEDLTVAVG